MSFFRRKRLFTILIGFIILVGLIGFSLRDRDELSSVEQFLQDVVGWMQQAVHTPVEYTTNIISNINDVKNVYQENQILKEQLARYQRNLYEVQELRKENQELMSILDKAQSDDITAFKSIHATISARSPEQWFKQVTINKGKQDGVQSNMAVITGEGMIGKVQSASQFTSTVLLLNGFDRSNRISVNVNLEGEEDASGFILGYDQDREALLLEFTDYEGEIPEGEFVFSSGLGGVFPKGLEIGAIQEMTTDQYGLTQVAYVKPSADLYNLNHVIVIDRNVITSDEETVEEEVE
ncbi:cell shape-determining protein MreC [Paraliobacillus quinghaiensis]|uniref:Cell shape-determining protein MreC n=1 Tax=Paraliobacillus quinghaiensis TaxID=470815 RepID=A0A917TL55_9BACI|nr:rod shape-determining protein MreC [Paraliobacillus quinghaiensis]GGM27330.1 cell shape-determining protein MreC [Paraliobacillus quinghaiensis]